MNHRPPEPRSLARPAYGAAAALALVGVGLVQVGWSEFLDPRSSAGRPSAAALLVIASLYLVASGWFYLQGAVRGANLGQAWWPRRLGLFCEGMLSGVVLAIMVRGHQSGVLSLGLWTVPPVLFAFSGVSGALTFLTWDREEHGLLRETAATGRGYAKAASYLRVVAAVLLLVILIVVEIGGRARSYIPLITTN